MKDQLTAEEQQKLSLKELKRITKEKKAELKIKELDQREAQLKARQQKQTDKLSIEAVNTAGRYGTKSEPRKALSTFFRNQNKIDISLVSILDRKAAILIRICSTIISGLVVFHDYIDNNVDSGHLISLVLMVGLMTTLVLAILATKPFVAKMRAVAANEIAPVYPELKYNVFTGSQVNCTLEEWEDAMQELVTSQDLQLGNQIRGSYIISKNNGFKSRLVDWAFNAFLCSFLIVGIIYVAAKFM